MSQYIPFDGQSLLVKRKNRSGGAEAGIGDQSKHRDPNRKGTFRQQNAIARCATHRTLIEKKAPLPMSLPAAALMFDPGNGERKRR